MIMGRRNIDAGYKDLCDADRLSRDERLASAANLLTMVTPHFGFEVEEVSEAIAEISEQHHADPDIVNSALIGHEPSLGLPYFPKQER